eukprot:Rmarinus@m.5996
MSHQQKRSHVPNEGKLTQAQRRKRAKNEFEAERTAANEACNLKPLSLDQREGLSREMVAHAKKVAVTTAEERKHAEAAEEVLNTCKDSISGVAFKPFGTAITGLGLTGSDLDLTVESNQPDTETLDAVAKAIENNTVKFKRLFRIRSKCPIIRFTHIRTRLQCDISANNKLGVANSHLIRAYVDSDPRVKPLILVVKHWAVTHGIQKRSKLSSYAITVMVLQFLQVQGVVPCLQKDVSTSSTVIDGWNCSYNVNTDWKSSNTASLGALLEEFFRFYRTSVDYKNSVISVRLGRVLRRPEDIGICRLLKAQQRSFGTPQTAFLWIEDPFELTHNLAHGVFAPGFAYLFRMMHVAAAALAKSNGSLAAILEPVKDEPVAAVVEKPVRDKKVLTIGVLNWRGRETVSQWHDVALKRLDMFAVEQSALAVGKAVESADAPSTLKKSLTRRDRSEVVMLAACSSYENTWLHRRRKRRELERRLAQNGSAGPAEQEQKGAPLFRFYLCTYLDVPAHRRHPLVEQATSANAGDISGSGAAAGSAGVGDEAMIDGEGGNKAGTGRNAASAGAGDRKRGREETEDDPAAKKSRNTADNGSNDEDDDDDDDEFEAAGVAADDDDDDGASATGGSGIVSVGEVVPSPFGFSPAPGHKAARKRFVVEMHFAGPADDGAGQLTPAFQHFVDFRAIYKKEFLAEAREPRDQNSAAPATSAANVSSKDAKDATAMEVDS